MISSTFSIIQTKKKKKNLKKHPKSIFLFLMVAYFSPLNASFFFYKLSQQAMSLYDDTIFEILFVIINTCLQLTYNIPDTTYLCRHEDLLCCHAR